MIVWRSANTLHLSSTLLHIDTFACIILFKVVIDQLGEKYVKMFSVIVSFAKGRYYETGNTFASELDELGYNIAVDHGH